MAQASEVPTSTGMALPDTSSQQATAASGIQDLVLQKRQSDAAVISLMRSASTPVPVSSPTPPELAIPQQPRFQPQPTDKREVVGHHNAKVQGISNTIIGATNLIGAVQQKDRDEKNRRLAVDIEHVYSATAGMQEAQSVLAQDPNNAQAKSALEKNKNLLDAILSDPKKRKQIATAFDISFTDPSQNNKPEHQAMLQATKSYSDQLANKLPTRLAPNQQAQEQLKTEMVRNEQISRNLEQQTRIQELNTQNQIRQELATEKVTHDRTTEQHATDVLSERKRATDAKLSEQWNIAKLSSNTRIQAASIAAQSHIQGVGMQVDGRLAAIDKIQADPAHTIKVYQKNLEDQQKLAAWLPQAINQANQLLKTKGITEEDYEKIVNPLKTSLEKTQSDINETQSTLDTLTLMYGEDSQEGGKPNVKPPTNPKRSSSNPSKPATKPQAAESPQGAGDSDSSHY